MAFDIEKARKNYRLRRKAQRNRARTLHKQAGADCRRIIDMIITRYNPRRIYQWGSLLKPSLFQEWSDIDIAVEGFKGVLDGIDALDEAGDLTSFPVDLVELERIHPAHACTIRTEGKVVYERK